MRLLLFLAMVIVLGGCNTSSVKSGKVDSSSLTKKSMQRSVAMVEPNTLGCKISSGNDYMYYNALIESSNSQIISLSGNVSKSVKAYFDGHLGLNSLTLISEENINAHVADYSNLYAAMFNVERYQSIVNEGSSINISSIGTISERESEHSYQYFQQSLTFDSKRNSNTLKTSKVVKVIKKNRAKLNKAILSCLEKLKLENTCGDNGCSVNIEVK